MSEELTRENVIQNKKESIKTLNKTLETFINDSKKAHLKKANLISYWLKSFSMYIEAEESFMPQRLLRYKRGNVIRVNFGFNIGKEFGGLHYAVVIDNDNKRNADVITVIPLSSTDGKAVHERSVDLGAELYSKIQANQRNLISSAQADLDELEKLDSSLSATIEFIKGIDSQDVSEEAYKKVEEALTFQDEINKRRKHIEQTIAVIKRNTQEISKLKIGSMALVNQITTVSKQRIFTPKRSEDFLYGISLSTSAMNKINDKIKELYVFNT